MALSVCFVFAVTIGIFPAVTVEAKSTIAKGGSWGECLSVCVMFYCIDVLYRNVTAVSFHRKLFHPGVLLPPVQHDGLGR